jgi:GNAT superfamily N-acetyltransferase
LISAAPVLIGRANWDHPWLLQMHQLTFPADEPPIWTAASWWLATQDGKPVGFAGVQRTRRWRDAGYLVRAGVVPAARGKGLQRRFLRVREVFARRQGWNWLVTATLHNPASANNLIAAGYRIYEPAAPWLEDGALYWRKRITHAHSPT